MTDSDYSESPGGDLVSPDWLPPALDTGVATPARMYAYYLGGKDHFAADREAAERVLESMPRAREFARANRAFLTRTVRHLAAEGITQFLDIGIGLPAPGGTTETALAVRPDARIVGVDNDPIVLAHARARHEERGPGPAVVVEGDVREPAAIVAHPEVRARLDFGQPIAVLLVAVLHFVEDLDDPAGVVRTLMEATAPGSVLVLSHGTADFDMAAMKRAAEAYDKSTARVSLRTLKEISGFFDGLEMLEPGVVLLPYWRPDGPVSEDAGRVWAYGGVARKA